MFFVRYCICNLSYAVQVAMKRETFTLTDVIVSSSVQECQTLCSFGILCVNEEIRNSGFWFAHVKKFCFTLLSNESCEIVPFFASDV